MDKNEKIQNLRPEDFYLKFVDGTLMPNSSNYIEVTMFDDVLFIKNSESEIEQGDISKISRIKNMIKNNLGKIEEIMANNGPAAKNSYRCEFLIQFDGNRYSFSKYACNDRGIQIFNEFYKEFSEILDFKNIYSENPLISAINKWKEDMKNVNEFGKMIEKITEYSFICYLKNGNQISVITNSRSEHLIPIFTNEEEMRKFIKESDGIIKNWDIYHIINILFDDNMNFDAVVIDPFGINLVIDKKIAKFIIDNKK